ncbi:AraC family ligand binding domain-containing protein [Azospirillum halopraeferens]|uniref:AraC family ligand binding domain-containing protein n=1 Tax=Azospirillum halopraeferens TaxID=34010 RepID=UPI0005596FEB|nr:AraC family ligand binding domain-containing protein [Azospirillum halopraeferens]
MPVQKFAIADAHFERLDEQEALIETANVVDQRHGGPVTVGFGRYGPGAVLEEVIAVYDTMIVLEGEISITSNVGTVTAEPGDIVYMPEGERVTIHASNNGALTAYVTYPHWEEARASHYADRRR